MLDRVVDEAAGGGHGYAALLALRTHEQASALLGRVAERPSPLALRNGSKSWRSSGAWAAAMSIDIDQYLPADINTKVDRATMSVSLEARVPFLGGPVARLAEAMPPSIKIHEGIAKWPLKELLRQRGFSEVFVNRPKTGFSFPMSEWLRRAVVRRPDLEALMRDPLPPLDRTASGRCLDTMLAGHDTGHLVWSVLVLSAWLTRFSR
jgi:asparagine synthase (glutamine-hydrolysing)